MLNTQARQQLQTLLPLGMVATKSWLQASGLNLHFVDNAIRSKTLVPLASGVYKRADAPITWQGVVASLQRMSDIPVHAGGLTAINLERLSHYLSMGAVTSVHLYSEKPLPSWLSRIDVKAQFEWHGTRRLWPDEVMREKRYLREDVLQLPPYPLFYSCPEKAMLELLSDVPQTISFEHADELMQNLRNLSPRKLDPLLKSCRNIKAKRLFFWFANRHQHPWLKHLNSEEYDFGSGKRVIASEGRLDPAWQITVPRDM